MAAVLGHEICSGEHDIGSVSTRSRHTGTNSPIKSADLCGSEWDWTALGDGEEPSLDLLNHILSEVTTGAPPQSLKLKEERYSREPLQLYAPVGERQDRGSSAAESRREPTAAAAASPRNSSWNTSRPSTSHSTLRLFVPPSFSQCGYQVLSPLPDDIVRYILSFLWPVRELFNARLACRGFKIITESLRIDCTSCGDSVGWQEALGCDSCFVSSCRACAGLQSMPDASIVKTYTAAKCKSCGGRLEHQWQCCPWCSTLRGGGAHKILRYIRSPLLRKPKSWVTHPCGHSMLMKRSCEACTHCCSQCGELACNKCIWCDGSRKACYSCTVTYGR